MRATYSALTVGMHHLFSRHGFSFMSASRRPTVALDRVSCVVRRTNAPASNSSVQCARPAGGAEQATATRRASSPALSFRGAPGRAVSMSARVKPSSTKCCLVRYTVEVPTPMSAAIRSSGTWASAARRICARLIWRAARVPPRVSACRWCRSSSVSVTR